MLFSSSEKIGGALEYDFWVLIDECTSVAMGYLRSLESIKNRCKSLSRGLKRLWSKP